MSDNTKRTGCEQKLKNDDILYVVISIIVVVLVICFIVAVIASNKTNSNCGYYSLSPYTSILNSLRQPNSPYTTISSNSKTSNSLRQPNSLYTTISSNNKTLNPWHSTQRTSIESPASSFVISSNINPEKSHVNTLLKGGIW